MSIVLFQTIKSPLQNANSTEAGVYYRGVEEINNGKVQINLPKYFDVLATDCTL